MYDFPSIYELGGGCSDSFSFLQGVLLNSAEMFNMEDSNVSPRSMAEAKALAASKSHSEAERRRRKRINGHLATLRTLLPNTVKTDKASLLAEVVRCIRELTKTTAELASVAPDETDDDLFSYKNNNNNNNGIGSSSTTRKYMFPSETDELKLSMCEGDPKTIKASLCCEDRPEMMVELRRALNSVEAKIVRAEMATVGGRIKSVLWLQSADAGGGQGTLAMGTLRKALKVVVDSNNKSTPDYSSNQQQQALPGYKRPRLHHC